VHPGLELKEVQVPPGALQSIVHRLRGGATARACQRGLLAQHIKADAAFGRSSLTSCTSQGACRPNALVHSASI